MPSHPNARSLCAAALAALLLCAHGASVGRAPTDSPPDDSSGEGEKEKAKPPELALLCGFIHLLLKTVPLQKDRDILFGGTGHKSDLSLPQKCPYSRFSKEACLQRLVEGLQTYVVLLKHVDREYPNNETIASVRLSAEALINLTKGEMKNPQRVKALTSSQEQQLLNTINYQDNFQRKREANHILIQFHTFLVDGKRATYRHMSDSLVKSNQSSGDVDCPQ